ncbi:MAG: NUDIX hydrolase [Actinomycetota bacterium]|nr:NUDIX hydrolase [Actinomycetota bacterium]
MEKKLFEKKISSKKIFTGKIIELYLDEVELPNDKVVTREKVKHPGAVGIVPLNREGKIILVKQFRYPTNSALLEIPAGKLGKNENAADCARRELKEEIGAVGGKIIHLTTFYTSPGFCDEILYLYLAIGFERKENNPDEDEFLDIVELKMKDSLAYINSGKIKDAKTIIGILLSRDYLNLI